jgi:hypothetical protein
LIAWSASSHSYLFREPFGISMRQCSEGEASMAGARINPMLKEFRDFVLRGTAEVAPA